MRFKLPFLLVALGAATVAFVAYQLGRTAGSREVPPPLVKIERSAPRMPEQPASGEFRTAAPTPDAKPVAARAASAPDPSSWRQVATPQIAASPATAPVESARGNAASDETRAVAAYFNAVERIQVASVSGSAESVGQEMVAALANGDTSGLDKMIRETEAAKASLAAVAPPAPCAALHQESLASLDDALGVLRALKAAMESSEAAVQLADVTARAQALRTRAEALQREERALRERYGLRR